MTFQEAKDKVKELANGKYHGLSIELNEFSSGEQRVECSIYITDESWYKGPTWEDAFKARERALQSPEEIINSVVQMTPQGDF
jgi:hypothetical protein